MGAVHSSTRLQSVLMWSARAAVGVVLTVAVVDWVGWATGIDALTRFFASWPQMTPWSAGLVAGLGIAIVAQSGRPSRTRVWAGCGLAVVTGALAVVFLAEYVTGRTFGLDQLWFPEAVNSLQATWPGRPSPRTAASVLMLAVAVGLTRADQPWTRVVRATSLVLAAVLPLVVVSAYLYDALSLVGIAESTGMGIATALAILLLSAATLLARPDRNPVAWLLARPDGWTLVRMVGVLAGPPILIASARLALLNLGLRDDAAWVLSISLSTVVVGALTFYLSQYELNLLIEKERLSRQRAEAESKRAEAEARYRILADNAVDVVLHLRGAEVVWVSPSVQAAFGAPPEEWIGTDFVSHIHPEDVDAIVGAMQEIASDNAVVTPRFRVRTAEGGYHWVDGRGRPYVDAQGNIDGATGSMRIVDDKVEAEQRLEQLARFDVLTGLTNRAETITRLEAAIEHPRSHGSHLGVLFCDIDQFKAVNDTCGHAVGDVVLATMAERIRDCVRAEDTVGRIGGDEMVVLLPGLHSPEEAAAIAEKIRRRAAEPIQHSGNTIQATISIGATVVAPGESVSAITARADEAMYRAKRAGRNRVTCI